MEGIKAAARAPAPETAMRVAALGRALDRLDIGLAALLERSAPSTAGVGDAALRAMAADRARLAQDLDDALARMRRREAELADLAEQASYSVAAAIDEVRAALGYAPQLPLPFEGEGPAGSTREGRDGPDRE